jgi:hypothetical protein
MRNSSISAMSILHGIAFLLLKYPYSMILFRMNTAISTIVVIAAALGTARGSSAAVYADATHFQDGTCTGPDKAKLVGE